MSSGLCGSNDSRLSSKASALEFAIAINSFCDQSGRVQVDYDGAKKLFDFITENVSLPEVCKGGAEELYGVYTGLVESLVQTLGKAKEKEVES